MIKAVVLLALVAVAFAAENKDLTSANTYGLGYAGAYGYGNGVYGNGVYGAYDNILGNRFGYGRSLGAWEDPAIGAYPYAHGAYPYVGGVYPRGARTLYPGVGSLGYNGYNGYTGYTGYPGYTPYAGVATPYY